MPYIIPGQRDPIEENLLIAFETLLETDGVDVGQLNYIISSMIDLIAYQKIKNKERVGYEFYNSMIGVLECAKLELYRRVVAPYEDIKLEENGDAYGHHKE